MVSKGWKLGGYFGKIWWYRGQAGCCRCYHQSSLSALLSTFKFSPNSIDNVLTCSVSKTTYMNIVKLLRLSLCIMEWREKVTRAYWEQDLYNWTLHSERGQHSPDQCFGHFGNIWLLRAQEIFPGAVPCRGSWVSQVTLQIFANRSKSLWGN